MLRRALISSAMILIALPLVRGQDAIPPETLAAVKHATVFVQVSGPGWKATGSGFVVAVDKDNVLIATNHHVISLPDNDKKPRLLPGELSKSLKQVNINVVFDSGTKSEVSMKGEPVAADPDIDLAVIRVSGMKDPPKPIDYAAQPKLSETMQIYSFGFPFGAALSTAKGSPAITVGKGSISSLRNDDNGELSIVQIDGALNPGNSGGPVVDSKGQLVGVAVATIRGGQGIGLAVPGGELGKIMKGRLGALHVTTVASANGKKTKAEIEVVDPSAAIQSIKLHYVAVSDKGTKPAKDQPLSKHPGAKSIDLKPSGDLASIELDFDAVDGDLYVQAVPEGGLAESGATPLRIFSMTAARGVAGQGSTSAPVNINVPALNAKPPEGWKDHVPKDKTYIVWIPTKNTGQSDREETRVSNGLRMKFDTLLVAMGGEDRFVVAEILILNAPAGAIKKAEGEDLLRMILIEKTRGRLLETLDVRMGLNTGKEFRVEIGSGQIRARAFVVRNRLMLISAEGSKAFVESGPAGIFLDSCRLTIGNLNAPPKIGPPVMPGPGPGPGPGPNVAAGRKSKIQGGFNDPEFTDDGPNGGLLIGVEVGIGKFFNNPIVNAARPIFRSGENEVTGAWHGPTAGRQLQKFVARPGYAVGAVTVKNGLTVDGMSLTFMKIVDGKLDPNDSYDSPWIGGQGGGQPVKVGGDGRLVVGLIGRAKNDALTGLGVLYPDDSQPPPIAPSVPMPSPPDSTPPTPVKPPVTPSPPSPSITPKTETPQGITTPVPKDDDAPKEKKSNTVLIIVVVALAAFFLLCAAGGLLFVLKNGGGSKRGGERRRRRDYDDDEDEDDDDRLRRRRR